MSKARLEAFSDGVLAIIITIMVLELKAPHGDNVGALRPLVPVFLSYVLSFMYVGIYWNNHHHMLHAARQINGRIMLANLHLLFWLSLIPAVTSWVGEFPHSKLPTALYGFVLLACAFAFVFLQRSLLIHNGRDSPLATAVGRDRKGLVSRVIYVVAILAAFVKPWISQLLYFLVAAMWFVPDPRIERRVEQDHPHSASEH
jgi:uncharacterized membrane protein